MEAPHDALGKMFDYLVRESARAEPNRETWGLLPEQQRLMQRAAAAGNNPAPSRVRHDGR